MVFFLYFEVHINEQVLFIERKGSFNYDNTDANIIDLQRYYLCDAFLLRSQQRFGPEDTLHVRMTRHII